MFRIVAQELDAEQKDKEREMASKLFRILAPVPDHRAESRIHTFTTK
ncbi:MAG TPA: hypothetical protein VFW94_18115 [Candidatus Acidoferrales bacterium]|nr:hypothetical protein [Candidatus Acidoferrales bacterium]